MKLDLTSLLLAIPLAFVIVGSAEFLHDLPGGERGLLLFEKTCPLHSSTVHVTPSTKSRL